MYREIFKIGKLVKVYTGGHKFLQMIHTFGIQLFDKEYLTYQHAVDDLDSLPKGEYQINKIFVKE